MAAEEGEVAVAAEGVGGAFGYLERLLERWLRRRSLRPGPRHGLGAGEHALPASAGQRGRGRAGRPVRQQHEQRHAAPALHAAHRQQHFASSRASSQSGFRVQPAPLLGPEPRDSASAPAELLGKLPQLGAVAPEPPASAELRPAGPRYRGGLDSPSPYKRK